MKKLTQLTLTILGSMVSMLCFSQQTFNNCTAAFLNNKMVVDKYTTKGRCLLTTKATGKLTVCTVDLSPTASKRVDPIPFRVAIRDSHTRTLLMLSKDDVKQVDIQQVMAKCKKGDSIVLLTTNDQYAMPHNEILVQ